MRLFIIMQDGTDQVLQVVEDHGPLPPFKVGDTVPNGKAKVTRVIGPLPLNAIPGNSGRLVRRVLKAADVEPGTSDDIQQVWVDQPPLP